MTTISTMIGRVRAYASEPSTAAKKYYTDSDIIDFMQTAINELCQETDVNQRIYEYTATGAISSATFVTLTGNAETALYDLKFLLYRDNDWQEELYSRVPGAASDHIDQELKSTLREFFTKSGFWTEELDPINIVASTDTYTLTPTSGVVMGLQAAWVDNKQVQLISIKPKLTPTAPSTPHLGYCPTPNSLQLFPTPSVNITDGLKVIVRLNPSADFSDTSFCAWALKEKPARISAINVIFSFMVIKV